MAATQVDHTLSAGFTNTDVLTALGEALADTGLMSSATGWYDSFTDTSGSEVRIVEFTAGAGVRGTVYYAFMCKSGETALWYTMYCQWDNTIHESTGEMHYDMVRNYEHPDDLSPASWATYYMNIAEMSNSADVTISSFTSAASKSAIIFIKSPSEQRTLGFALPGATVDPNAPAFDELSPAGIWASTVQTSGTFNVSTPPDCYITDMLQLKSNMLFGWANSSTSSNDWTPGVAYTGLLTNGSNTPLQFSSDISTFMPPYAQPNDLNGNPDPGKFYGVTNIPLYGNQYTDVTSGDFGFIYSTTAAYTPTPGDTLVATAGVEEYLVLSYNAPASSATTNHNTWNCSVVRTV